MAIHLLQRVYSIFEKKVNKVIFCQHVQDCSASKVYQPRYKLQPLGAWMHDFI